MDDFNVSSLHESKNEWGARLLTILTPLIIEGFKSIFDESYKLCKDNNEMDKYLMTFQNLIARIPKWSNTIIESECERIIERSHCKYLEDLVSCIHIIQLKLLTAIRVGQTQKKIDIDIPKLGDFIHKSYINVARKIYKNTYLFELNVAPLQVQRNNRELETIVQESILNAVRDSIPVETILRAYMDETTEEDVSEEIKEEIIVAPVAPVAPVTKTDEKKIDEIISEGGSNTVDSGLKFNDMDAVLSDTGSQELISAPKSIERLEELSNLRNQQRKSDEDDDDCDKLNISPEDITLDILDIHDINQNNVRLNNDMDLDEIEILA